MDAKVDEIISISRELIGNIEDSSINAENLVHKAFRLAHLADNKEILAWLHYEKFGYNFNDPLAIKYLGLTSRWINFTEKKAYVGNLAAQETMIATNEIQIETYKKFAPSGTYALMQLDQQNKKIAEYVSVNFAMKQIVSRVRSLIHEFASKTYYEMIFRKQAETIFDLYSSKIDSLLADTASDVLQKIPVVFKRLNEKDADAISQALLICRRILDDFINKLYPPTDKKIVVGDEEISLTADKTKNRYRAYFIENILSQSRKDKLNKLISILYERTSTGVHADFDEKEAQSIILQLYVTLGEIVSLQVDRNSESVKAA